jgi:hypothetical protein
VGEQVKVRLEAPVAFDMGIPRASK